MSKYENHPMQLASYLPGKIVNDMALSIIERQGNLEDKNLGAAIRHIEMAMRLIKNDDKQKKTGSPLYTRGAYTPVTPAFTPVN